MRAEDGREGPVSMTVGGLCEEWLRSVKPMVKPSTYACYLAIVEKHIRGELGKVRQSKYDESDDNGLYTWQTEAGTFGGDSPASFVFFLKSIVQTGEEVGHAPEKHCI